MSDENDIRTREQLLAEIESLKRELDQRGKAAQKPVGEALAAAPSAPNLSAPITRRQSLAGWVAPVILSLPVVQAVSMALKPGIAYALVTRAPTASTKKGAPTPFSTTAAPTVQATGAPTRAGRCIVPPPTASPTLGMAAAPDSSPNTAFLIPLGSARAASRGHITL